MMLWFSPDSSLRTSLWRSKDVEEIRGYHPQ